MREEGEGGAHPPSCCHPAPWRGRSRLASAVSSASGRACGRVDRPSRSSLPVRLSSMGEARPGASGRPLPPRISLPPSSLCPLWQASPVCGLIFLGRHGPSGRGRDGIPVTVRMAVPVVAVMAAVCCAGAPAVRGPGWGGAFRACARPRMGSSPPARAAGNMRAARDKYIMEQKYTAAAVCGRLATSGGPLSSQVRLPTAMRGE